MYHELSPEPVLPAFLSTESGCPLDAESCSPLSEDVPAMSPLVPQVRLDAQETEGCHLPIPQRDADVADKQRSRKAAFHYRGPWPATKGTSSDFDRTSPQATSPVSRSTTRLQRLL